MGRLARLRRSLAMVVLLPLVAVDLSACSAFLFDDDELEPQRISALPPAESEDYPNLASVPDEAPLPSSRVRRLDLSEGLASDRENAIYTDETLQAQPATVPPSPQLPDPALAAPPPPALDQSADLRPLEQPDFGAAPPPPAIAAAEEEDDLSPILPPPPIAEGDAVPSALDESLLPDYSSSPQLAAVPQRPEYQQPQGAPPQYGAAGAAQPPVLLQQQAIQQQIYEANQLQNLAMQQQAFAFEARRQAIEQQQLREQIIDQRAWQLQTLQAQARQQLAILPQSTPAVPPIGYAGSGLPIAPQVAPQVAAPLPAQSPAQTQVASYGYGAAPVLPASVPAQSYGQAQASGAGQLVGLIYFGHGSISLNSTDRQVLRQVVNLQQQTGGRPLRVVGHASARTSVTDPVKHRMTNLNVSMSRANKVASELVRMGVAENAVMIIGKADSEPVYHEFMPTGEAGNRRVEIFIE